MPAPVIARAIAARGALARSAQQAAIARSRTPSATVSGAAGGFGPGTYRVGNLSAAGILTIALLFDGLQVLLVFFHIVPIIGTAIAFMGSLLLGVIGNILIVMAFVLCGVKFISGKRATGKIIAALGPAAVEITGLLSWIPALTLGAGFTLMVSRIEDKELRAKQREADARALEARRRASVESAQMGAAITEEGEQEAAAQNAPQVLDLSARREATQQKKESPLANPDFAHEARNFDAEGAAVKAARGGSPSSWR